MPASSFCPPILFNVFTNDLSQLCFRLADVQLCLQYVDLLHMFEIC